MITITLRPHGAWSGLALALLLPVTAAPLAAQKLAVDGDVRISKELSHVPHGEIAVVASATDPSLLFGCSRIYPKDRMGSAGIIAYRSLDRGKSWRVVATFPNGTRASCEIGPEGTWYLALATDQGVELRRSVNQGTSWSAPISVTGGSATIPSLQVLSDQKHRGRVYLVVQARSGEQPGVQARVFISENGGETFLAPITRESPSGDLLSSGALLANGTWIAALASDDATVPDDEACERHATGRLTLVSLPAAASDFRQSSTIAVLCRTVGQGRNPVAVHLATDQSEGAFDGRIYAVWVDRRASRDEIMVSSSADAGATWARPTAIDQKRKPREVMPYNADVPPPVIGWERHNYAPRVAVNNRGVVGIAWADRRDNLDNMGSWQRFTASVDGGGSWLPSVRVSTDPSVDDAGLMDIFAIGRSRSVTINGRDFLFGGGELAGMVADNGGVFHPFWIDNRTGSPQTWVSAVTLQAAVSARSKVSQGAELPNGVDLDIANVSVDGKVVTVDVRIRNHSDAVVKRPVYAALSSIRSALGPAIATNADNSDPKLGAVWDLSETIPARGLPANSLGAPRRITFQLSRDHSLVEVTGRPADRADLLGFKLGLVGARP